MKVKGVYLNLNPYKYSSADRVQYQICSNYLTLFVSTWLSSKKLELGNFNRFIFEEGAREDMMFAGDRAFVVDTKERFDGVKNILDKNIVHKYFSEKYVEGFRKIDEFFTLDLSNSLKGEIESGFYGGFKYEELVQSVKKRGGVFNVLHRYWYDRYELVVISINKDDVEAGPERVVLTLLPDPFIVHFEVNKIEVVEKKLFIINKIRERKYACDL